MSESMRELGAKQIEALETDSSNENQFEILNEPPPEYAPRKPTTGPIRHQPTAYPHPEPSTPCLLNDWMAFPFGVTNCPPGLEYLSMVNSLLVQQKVEVFETITGFESNKRYTIKNTLGQKVYLALEDSNWFNRMGGAMRPFEMRILNNHGKEVIHIHRPLACHGCLCPFWLQNLAVFSPPGTKVGSIEQEWTIMRPQYLVKNAAGETVLKIRGPTCRFTFAVDFIVCGKDGNEVGKITKHWSGLAREVFTDKNYFGICFPMDLDVKMKAVLLGACFLIDFMFFED